MNSRSIAFLLIVTLIASIPFLAQGQISTQLLKKFEGVAEGNNLGYSVSFIGDLDSDGSSDILLGAPGASPGGLSGAGSAYLYSGRTFSLIHRFDGQSVGEDFGIAIAGIDDLSGDGVPDILIGSDAADPGGRTNAGNVYVYSGASPFTLIRQIDGEVAEDFFGTSVAVLGNVAGDGRPEFAVGAIGADPDAQRTNAGRVSVYYGNFTLLAHLDGYAAQDDFGVSVAGPGDVNGDLIPDILVGADVANPGNPARVNAGSAYLFSGQSLTLLRRFDGEVAGDFFGTSVVGAGDVDGDSRPDVLVGAPGADPTNMTEAGSAYLFSGATGTLLHRFDGGSTGDDFGWRVATIGDTNGNGVPDMAIAADLADPAGIADAGSVYLYSGSDYSSIAQINGLGEGDNFGSSLAGGADTSGDGMLELLIGAPYNSPSGLVEAGSAYLYNLKPLPVAQFLFTPAKPLIGESVSFNGSTSFSPNGPIVSYSWAFGDGASSTGVAVSHTYAAAGNYLASLTVVDSTSAMSTTTRTITVNPPNQPPAASFAFSPSRPVVGNPVTFNASASLDTDGSIVTYSWSFGDGSGTILETDPITLHAYSTSGPFTVRLNVTDDDGAVGSASLSITIAAANQPPNVRFTHLPASPLEGQTVSFDASLSADTDGTIVSYSWNLGDGSTRSGVTITYSYLTAANYTVILTLIDDSDASNSTTQQVQVLLALTVTASASTTGGNAPVTVTFTGEASGGVSPYSYSWDFGDGQATTEDSPTHQYSSPGSYQAELNVTDSLGNTATDTITITVVAVLPGLAVTASYEPTGGIAPFRVQFNATASGGQGSYTFTWDFGDGQTLVGALASHTYSIPGDYTVRVTVQDAQGNTSSDTIVVTVLEQQRPMVGPLPAEYVLYGLVAAIAGVVMLAVLYLQRPRPESQPPKSSSIIADAASRRR